MNHKQVSEGKHKRWRRQVAVNERISSRFSLPKTEFTPADLLSAKVASSTPGLNPFETARNAVKNLSLQIPTVASQPTSIYE
ncbi:hypothetical protein [Candidatus Propionivibrio aalborgensis]|uniref:hypothetical protein n=1 Tax=Candidatus Propionivibrio aalborgensis TaxID=1860101 RepID=UPI001C91B0A6|nr:hypothetical protein [Candidatus Propionivibrio aalborgensis]